MNSEEMGQDINVKVTVMGREDGSCRSWMSSFLERKHGETNNCGPFEPCEGENLNQNRWVVLTETER